jgi:hypothetical protein
MAGSEEDQGRSRRLGAEDRGCSGTSQVHGGRTIGRLSDVMCDLHRTCGGDKNREFFGLASKPLVTVC